MLCQLRLSRLAPVCIIDQAGCTCTSCLDRHNTLPSQKKQVDQGFGRLRLIAERKCDEKVIDSKVTYLQASPPELSIPSPVLPTSSSSESDYDDFVNVKVRTASWAAPGLSVLTMDVVRRSSSSPGGRGSPAARRDRPSRPLASLPLHLLLVRHLPFVDRQANHRRRQLLRIGVQQRNPASFFSGARTSSPEMTPFLTLRDRKLAHLRGGRLRSGKSPSKCQARF
jgi:hypothetical protein